MKLDIYHLSGSGFHFGRHGRGQENCAVVFPSDSVFSALAAQAAQFFPPERFQDWLAPFVGGSPPFVLTSMFPCAGAIRFFPKPQLPIGTGAERSGKRSLKSIRKIAYVSEAVFRSLISGAALAPLISDDCLLQGGSVLISAAERSALPAGVGETGRIWEMTTRPRVTVSRTDMMSDLFHLAEMRFSRGCGLWFGVRWLTAPTDSARSELEALIAELGESGIGAERSIGLGQFKLSAEGPIEFIDGESNADQAFITLSRFIPKASELKCFQSRRAAYAIESVGGWVSSPGKAAERRRAIRMVSEGACLSFGGLTEPIGRIVDVQPDYGGTRPIGHPVYRSGYALSVACALPAEG